ncbi:hypothetical protein [Endozoicomonas euniceicola]|uniref:Uncharacterized protein n=1 Tax=Endozoicomonas euniceicola TaxID=1234143 RepID=A0ABY6GW60_9GAMM|nr:hypothetical protein [Endozoicomonas euniceicola]UYM17002.1 hypothetical protein NX720_03490 [Endozoicomonas euniceicola]
MNQDKNNDDLWSAVSRIEISVKNSQNHIKRLFLHSTRHEIAIELLAKKIDANQQENRERFDQIDKRFEQQDKRFEQQDSRFDQIDKRFEQQDKRFDQLELLIRQLIPSANN